MLRNQREQTLRYIRDRRCASGGYCFYRLDEPNAADTFYALASYRLLDEPVPDDEATVRLLHRFQHIDGSYANVHVGNAVIRGLVLLGERPAQDPLGWILHAMDLADHTARPVESVSEFEQLVAAVECCTALGIAIPAAVSQDLVPAILRYRHSDGGFGSGRSTLVETSHVTAILAALGCDMNSLGLDPFIRRCEDSLFGFLAVPGVRPGFLEHVHAGLRLCATIGYHPSAWDTCDTFIHRCFRGNGGYCRSLFGGSATLEYTYLALDSLAMIPALGNNALMRPR